MNLNDYQTKALRTANPRDRKNELFHLLLGLCGEAGEIAEKTKKIIRDKDKRCKMHRKFYSALSTGLIVKGKIIKTVDDLVLFDVVSSYNPADVVEMAEAIREFNKYNNNDKLEVNFDW